MKKVKLDVNALRVESFAPGAGEPARGTVHGLLRYTDPQVCPYSQNWYCTVGDGCTWYAYTCHISCNPDCHSDEVCIG